MLKIHRSATVAGPLADPALPTSTGFVPEPPALAAVEVTRHYGEGESIVHALRGVTLEVPAGQFLAVMGPSGSGKSTLMHVLAGLDRPDSGRVEIGGEDITRMGDKQLTLLRRREVGFVFQAFNLLPTLTAEENVRLPLALAGEKRRNGNLDALLERVGLAARRSHRPAQLSGGQQQRVAIARALITEPTVVFADEPTGNLDSTSSGEILSLLQEASEEERQTIVMVTHDPRAAAIADRVVFLDDGRITNELRGQFDEADVLSAVKEVSAR